ncbi:hypothetical protein ACJ41O_014254 [Fusarium nematophilum]
MPGQVDIPGSSRQWTDIARHIHPGGTDISGIGQGAFGSASKLKYEDWMLLRVIWPSHHGQPTYNSVFGSAGQEWRARAEAALSPEPWMQALLAGDNHPLAWSILAPWKLSANDISRRLPAQLDLPSGAVYDDLDPFRVVVEPSDPRSRPRRNTSGKPSDPFETAEAKSQQMKKYIETYDPQSSSAYPPPPARPGHSRPGDKPPSSASPNSSTGRRASPSDANSGLSLEGRLINKHRPDEAIINMSLVLLLQGVTMSLLQTKKYEPYDWTILHKLFSVTQPNPDNGSKRTRLLTAKSDGCLQVSRPGQDPDNGDTLAIIEVKPYRRLNPVKNAAAVRVQEGAEMAAWISTEPRRGLLPASAKKGTYRRLLVSQDFDEIYITIAEFDEAYVRYIRGDSVSWPLASRRAPEDSPSRDPRPSTVAAGPSQPTAEERGRPVRRDEKDKKKEKEKEKDKKPGLFDKAFKSSSKATGSSTKQKQKQPPPQPAAPLEPRHQSRTVPQYPPATPERPRPTRSQEPPQAPKQAEQMPTAGAVDDAGTGGFLRMNEYAPFRIDNRKEMAELALLLYSLTEYICETDTALHLQYDKPKPRH